MRKKKKTTNNEEKSRKKKQNAKSNKKGRIEIEYYSEEDLERIVSLLETIK